MSKTKTGAELITIERARQIARDGFSADHDDEHTLGELSEAAACYARAGDTHLRVNGCTILIARDFAWPWETYDWKPCPQNRVKELVKAGALIAAEIDRLQRLRKFKNSK